MKVIGSLNHKQMKMPANKLLRKQKFAISINDDSENSYISLINKGDAVELHILHC